MMYKKHTVFRRNGNDITVYVCLERVGGKKFAVHQAEFIPYEEVKRAMADIDANFLELFSEEDPDERCQWLPSLQEAIEDHDRAFEN